MTHCLLTVFTKYTQGAKEKKSPKTGSTLAYLRTFSDCPGQLMVVLEFRVELGSLQHLVFDPIAKPSSSSIKA